MITCLHCGSDEPTNLPPTWWKLSLAIEGCDEVTYHFCSIKCIDGRALLTDLRPIPEEEKRVSVWRRIEGVGDELIAGNVSQYEAKGITNGELSTSSYMYLAPPIPVTH